MSVLNRCGGKSSVSVVDRDFGAVGLGVHRQLDVVSRLLGAGAGVDHHRLAGGDQAVHAGGGDADALLAAGHLQAVELGAEEQPAEDVLDLLADDARAVVDDGDAIARLLGGGGAVGLQVLDDDRDVGQDAGLFAGIQRVVDRFLDAWSAAPCAGCRSRAGGGSWRRTRETEMSFCLVAIVSAVSRLAFFYSVRRRWS